MAMLASPPSAAIPAFDPALWLRALTDARSGYALGSSGQLHFLVEECDAEALTGVMAQIIGHADRREAVKRAIEQRQGREA